MKNLNKTKGKIQNISKKIKKDTKFNSFATKNQNKKDSKSGDRQSVLAKLQKSKKGNVFKDHRSKKEIKQVKSQERGLIMGQQRKSKVSKYQLMSDDEDEENQKQILNLTHGGKNLEKLDDFKEELDNYSDDDDQQELMDKLNFQGFDEKELLKLGANGGQKSKKEIYEEIIKKSKLMKHEKQKQKEDDKEKLMELEDNFDEIQDLLKFRGKEQKQKDGEEFRAQARKNNDDFDILAKELQFEGTASAAFEPKKDKKENKRHEQTKTRSKNEAQQQCGVLSSDEEDDGLVNDDELNAGTVRREKKVMKHIRNVEKLNNYMDKIKNVKADRLKREKIALQGSDFEDDDEDDDDEDQYDDYGQEDNEGEESESDSGEGLQGMDLNQIEKLQQDEEENGSDLEDEFEEEEDLESDEYDNVSQ